MKRLPVDHRGYPVPWFVAWVNENDEPMPRGEGHAEFRLQMPNAVPEAHNNGRCWVCGDKLGKYRAFVAGPMCAVNRTSSEPPSHLDCGDWSARACPFLSRPHARRREAGLPAGCSGDGSELPGTAIMRNPGVALVWVTTRYRLMRVPNGVLFHMGEPTETRWYCEGRPATRSEVEESIDSGVPLLRDVCRNVLEEAALIRAVKAVQPLLPA